MLLEITKAKRESFFPCYQWCTQNASNYSPLVYLPLQRGEHSKAYLVHWLRLDITSATCFDHDLHGSGGSLGANVLPLPWWCPLHSLPLRWHTLPFPYSLPCTRWNCLKPFIFSRLSMFKSLWWPLIESLACLLGPSVISTLESWFPPLISMSPPFRSDQSSFFYNHAILQTSSLALIRNPLYSFHALSPTHSLSSASSPKGCLLAPVHTETFLPATPRNPVKRITLHLITRWVLYREAFILWQVWLPKLIFSKMTNLSSLIGLFFPFILLKISIGNLWTSQLQLLFFSAHFYWNLKQYDL